MNKKIADFFEAQSKREEEAKKNELQAMVDAFGIDTVIGAMIAHLNEINGSISEITKEEAEDIINQIEEAKQIISTSKYLQVGKRIDGSQISCPVEFSDETKKVLEEVSKETKTPIYNKKGKKLGQITHKGFAYYIIKASGNDGEILKDIIKILKDATWDTGFGITADKMEIVYHTLVLHKERRSEIIPIITKLLVDYDMKGLKYAANKKDEYRNHLSYKEKMMMFVEDYVCEKICERPLFAREIASAS